MLSERFRIRPFGTSLLALGVAVLVAGCAALHAAMPPTRIASTSGNGTTDVSTADARRVAHAECEATLAQIPLVEVVSGKPTLAAAYAVSGSALDRYLSDQASKAGIELGSTGRASARSDAVSMCLFDGDFLTNTPGPLGHDRSAVSVLVVVVDGKAQLWSIAREKAALPARDPGLPAMTPSARAPAPSAPTPTTAPLPSPGTEASPTGLGWAPVSLSLTDGHWLTGLTAWAGGFAALESDDDDVLFALWTSSDGTRWQSTALPEGVDNGRLVALGDHLYLQESRGRGDPQEVRIRTWRTDDGQGWRRQGLFEWHLPKSVGDEWRIVTPFLVAAPDRLVMFGEVVPCCGTGGSVPLGSKYASIMTAVYPERIPLRGLVIWTSPDGERWTRQSNADLREPISGNAWITDAAGVPGGVLATRGSTDDGLFASPDGSAWESIGPLPPGYKFGPSLGLAATDGRVIVSFDAEGPNNTLEVWVRDDGGSWILTLQAAYTTTDALVATGQLVVASGLTYDGVADSWPRIFVSTDGGATWDPDLSWSGARGGCARDLATDGARFVLLGCEEGSPTLWYADVPGPAAAVTGERPMRASLLFGLSLTLALGAAAGASPASPVPSGTSMPEPSCPPPPDRLLVAPVGAAWIGEFEGVFELGDGRPPQAIWAVEETLVGGPLAVGDLLTYEQPACDAVLGGGQVDRYLVTTADPSSPTTDDTVMWWIGPGDSATLVFPDLDTPLSGYGVDTLEAARALVLSGAMPPGLVPSPSVAPACPLSAGPRPSPEPGDREAARAALRAYYDDARAGRRREAWDRLSPWTQAMWGTFEAFAPATQDTRLRDPTTERDALCLWMTMAPMDFGDADTSRAWLIEATHGPIATNAADVWIVAPLPDGTWRLWQVC